MYKAGLAAGQAAYEEAFDALFTTLSALEERLGRRRFLLGGQISEADVRLYPTLARFDAVYHTLYKCNLHRLIDYPSLWGYARDLYRAAGLRGHHRLRSDQAPLLPDPGLDQPHPDRAQGPLCELALTAGQRAPFRANMTLWAAARASGSAPAVAW